MSNPRPEDLNFLFHYGKNKLKQSEGEQRSAHIDVGKLEDINKGKKVVRDLISSAMSKIKLRKIKSS